jgi:putative ABC transport system permease protein
VAAACVRNNLGAEIHHQGERVTCVVHAIDPVQDRRVFQISEKLIEGSYLDPEETDQILLGLQIAGSDRENLEYYSSSLKTVHAGDSVIVDYVNGLEKEYTVKGIFYTELIQSDIRAYITEKEFNSMYPLMDDKATSIHVKLEPKAKPELVIEQMGGLRPGLRFQTWEDALGVLRSMTKSFEQIIVILRATALIVAAITIFIVTYVDLANKRRQIGIERAIGITSASIVISYVIRAVLYAVFGILAAALIFVYVVVPIEAHYPFHFPFGDVFLPVSISYLASSALVLCAVAIVSAFIPAWQTVRTKIIDAIWAS